MNITIHESKKHYTVVYLDTQTKNNQLVRIIPKDSSIPSMITTITSNDDLSNLGVDTTFHSLISRMQFLIKDDLQIISASQQGVIHQRDALINLVVTILNDLKITIPWSYYNDRFNKIMGE